MYVNYYTLFLMPVGIAICLLIKFGSDSSISKRAIAIDCIDHLQASKNKLNKDVLLSAVSDTRGKNDRCFIIRGLPVRFGEVELQRYESINTCGPLKEKGLMKTYVELNTLGTVCGDMLFLDVAEDYRDVFAARMAYDLFIEKGIFAVGKKDDIWNFLSRNRIVTLNGLDYRTLSASGCGKALNVFSLSKTEGKILSVSGLRFSRSNSLFLMLSISGLAKVIEC